VIELTTSLLDSTWCGTHEGFVLMWKEKMRLLEDMTSSQYHYADEVKLSMLQNGVLLVSKLSQIRDINDNLAAVGSLPLDYTTYSNMLISACNQLDKDLEVPRNSKITALLTTRNSKRRITSSKVTQAMNSVARAKSNKTNVIFHSIKLGQS
jgi:hypothetical protein